MTDNYQAVYDAVRSRFGSVSANEIIAQAVRDAFDISWQKEHLQQEIYSVSAALTRPSVLYRPLLAADGTSWMVLLGEDLQSGIAGFGDTPAQAMAAFDRAFMEQRTPDAIRKNANEAAA